jgi:hypothetical protein
MLRGSRLPASVARQFDRVRHESRCHRLLRPGFSPALLPEFSSMASRLQIAPMRIEKRPSDEKTVQLAMVKTEMKKMAQTRGKK